MNQQIIAKMCLDCGRMGRVEGLFRCTQSQLQWLNGKSFNFGEILGKHSEIYGKFQSQDFTIWCDNSALVEQVTKGMNPDDPIVGYSPFDYVDEEQ